MNLELGMIDQTNISALSLYHKYQFAETGEMNEDEIVIRLNL